MTLIPNKAVLVYLCKKLLILFTVILFNVVFLGLQSSIKPKKLNQIPLIQEIMLKIMNLKILNKYFTLLIHIV